MKIKKGIEEIKEAAYRIPQNTAFLLTLLVSINLHALAAGIAAKVFATIDEEDLSAVCEQIDLEFFQLTEERNERKNDFPRQMAKNRLNRTSDNMEVSDFFIETEYVDGITKEERQKAKQLMAEEKEKFEKYVENEDGAHIFIISQLATDGVRVYFK